LKLVARILQKAPNSI